MMVQSAHLTRYLEEAKIEELRREWEARGYKVIRNRKIGNLTADLVVLGDNRTIVYEVKTAESLARTRETVSRLAQLAATRPNTSFHLVIANPPQKMSIEIDGLAEALFAYIHQTLPSELDRLATHTCVESVDDVEVFDVRIRPGEIRAVGNGIVEVELQYGSRSDLASDQGLLSHETFTFEFDVTLSAELAIIEMNRLDIDTSSFDE